MKTKTFWKSVASVILLMAMIVLVTVSCKKKDDETPVTPPPPEPTVGKLFTNLNGYNFLTKEEQNNQGMYFSGDYLFTYARGIHQYCTGGTATEIPYFDIFTFAHELESEKKLEDSLAVNFRKIDQSLAKIQQQLKTLIIDVEALNIKLELGILDIEAMMQGYISANLTDDLLNSMDSTSPNGIRYYSKNAHLLQQGNPNAVPFATLKQQLTPDFINRYYGNPTVNLALDIEKIGQLIIGSTQPSLPSFANSTLKTFIDKELLQTKTLYNDSANAMYTYKFLEDFFLTSLNYQYQGLMVYGNCVLGTDTSGTAGGKQQLSQWYNGTYVPYLIAELKVFNQAVAYLATNYYDYRNEARWKVDIQNFENALTEDFITGPVYARANLVNSLILNAIGQTNQSIYFQANLPQSYVSYMVVKIQNGGGFTLEPTGSVNSQFYFTKWTSPTSIVPEYTLNRFNYQFDYSGPNPGQVFIYPLIQGSVGGAAASNSCIGTIPRIFVDPTNIRSQSNTADATHILPFGSGTVNWPWGYCNLSWNAVNISWTRRPSVRISGPPFGESKVVNLPSFNHCTSSHSFSDHTNNIYFHMGASEIYYSGPTIADNSGWLNFNDVQYMVLSGASSSPVNSTKLFSRIICDPPDGWATLQQFWPICGVEPNITAGEWALYSPDYTRGQTGGVADYFVPILESNKIAFGYAVYTTGSDSNGPHEFGTIFQTQPIFMGLAPIFP